MEEKATVGQTVAVLVFVVLVIGAAFLLFGRDEGADDKGVTVAASVFRHEFNALVEGDVAEGDTLTCAVNGATESVTAEVFELNGSLIVVAPAPVSWESVDMGAAAVACEVTG